MNLLNIIKEEIEKMHESSLGRIYQHLKSNKKFAMMSPNRGNLTPQENKERYKELKKQVREMGFGFIELGGGYQETTDDGGTMMVNEDSLLIPMISKEQAIQLGQMYQQDSVIYKDETGETNLISTDQRTGTPIGQSIMEFNPEYDFSSDTHDFVYSKLKKGQHSDRKFALQGKEED